MTLIENPVAANSPDLVERPAIPARRPTSSPPFEIARPAELPTPLVFASPHSGRLYPAAMRAASDLDGREIRRSEDCFVDRLAASAPGFGIPLLTAVYARAYVDVNRAPYELDPQMMEGGIPPFEAQRTARAAAGLGSVARIVAEGKEIYRGKLDVADVHRRIETVHHPYHEALAALIEEVVARHGRCILVDLHSMPSAAATANGRPVDLVLGDRFGAACAPGVTARVETELRANAFSTVRNTPYAGGYTTEHYGRPRDRVHGLQLEISRGLYLDEAAIEPAPGFKAVADRFAAVFAALARTDWTPLAR